MGNAKIKNVCPWKEKHHAEVGRAYCFGTQILVATQPRRLASAIVSVAEVINREAQGLFVCLYWCQIRRAGLPVLAEAAPVSQILHHKFASLGALFLSWLFLDTVIEHGKIL